MIVRINKVIILARGWNITIDVPNSKKQEYNSQLDTFILLTEKNNAKGMRRFARLLLVNNPLVNIGKAAIRTRITSAF